MRRKGGEEWEGGREGGSREEGEREGGREDEGRVDRWLEVAIETHTCREHHNQCKCSWQQCSTSVVVLQNPKDLTQHTICTQSNVYFHLEIAIAHATLLNELSRIFPLQTATCIYTFSALHITCVYTRTL